MSKTRFNLGDRLKMHRNNRGDYAGAIPANIPSSIDFNALRRRLQEERQKLVNVPMYNHQRTLPAKSPLQTQAETIENKLAAKIPYRNKINQLIGRNNEGLSQNNIDTISNNINNENRNTAAVNKDILRGSLRDPLNPLINKKVDNRVRKNLGRNTDNLQDKLQELKEQFTNINRGQTTKTAELLRRAGGLKAQNKQSQASMLKDFANQQYGYENAKQDANEEYATRMANQPHQKLDILENALNEYEGAGADGGQTTIPFSDIYEDIAAAGFVPKVTKETPEEAESRRKQLSGFTPEQYKRAKTMYDQISGGVIHDQPWQVLGELGISHSGGRGGGRTNYNFVGPDGTEASTGGHKYARHAVQKVLEPFINAYDAAGGQRENTSYDFVPNNSDIKRNIAAQPADLVNSYNEAGAYDPKISADPQKAKRKAALAQAIAPEDNDALVNEAFDRTANSRNELDRQLRKSLKQNLGSLSQQFINKGQYNSLAHQGRAAQVKNELENNQMNLRNRILQEGLQSRKKFRTDTNANNLNEFALQEQLRGDNTLSQLDNIRQKNNRGYVQLQNNQGLLDDQYSKSLEQEAYAHPSLRRTVRNNRMPINPTNFNNFGYK